MAGIPMGALRRALSEFSRDASRGAGFGFAAGYVPPGAGFGHALEQGAKGALLGAGAGAGVGMGVRSTMNLARTLREALADAAAERGMGRAAMRESADLDDAARFHGAGSDGQFYDEAARTGTPVAELRARAMRDVPLVEEMRMAGQRPFSRAPSPMDEMNELSAANRILVRLRNERRTASDPDEIADIDEQITELERLLGM